MSPELKMTVQEYDGRDVDDDKYLIMFGGNPDNPTEEEYFRDIDPDGKIRPHFELIKKWALSQDVIPGGVDVNDSYFMFSDGRAIAFSHRGWGDFAQAIAGKREGYMKYYWSIGGRYFEVEDK